MEPILETSKELLPVLEDLKNREPLFHHPELGTRRVDYENMTDPEFWEVGASGRRYCREYCINNLVERYSKPYEDDLEMTDCHCTQIAPDNYLVTYTLSEDGTRITRRATIWRRTQEGWKILYHQGTLVEDA